MPVTNVSDLVSDWGGFEELVAELHTTGEVTVERDVTLIGKSGAPRQVDVLVRHTQGLYDHLIIIECKYLKRPVGRQAVDTLVATVEELNASKGVIFSRKGFQAGAIKQAKHHGIELFAVRSTRIICDERYVNCTVRLSMWSAEKITSLSPKNNMGEFERDWGVKSKEKPKNDSPGFVKKIEGCKTNTADIEELISNKFKIIYAKNSSYFRSNFNGNIIFKDNIEFDYPHLVTDVEPNIEYEKMRLELGAHVLQMDWVIDRLENLAFLFALEDCVKNELRPVSKRKVEIKNIRINQEKNFVDYQNNLLIERAPKLVVDLCLGAGHLPGVFSNLNIGEIQFKSDD